MKHGVKEADPIPTTSLRGSLEVEDSKRSEDQGWS